MWRGTRRSLTGVSGVLLATCLLAACGGDGSHPEEAGGKTSLTVGVMATADLARLYMARKDGLFTDEGLTEGPTENLPVAGWTATEQFVQENPDAVAAFVRAMDRAMSRAQAHRKALEQTIPSYTDLSPGLAHQLTEPGLATRSDLSDLDDLEALMIEHGIIDARLDLDQV
ncbi:MAG: hypothetical protein ACRDO0_04675, partial [Nocardioidaceae bacterium]